MQMEIISPKEGGFLTEIKWNNEELLAAIKEKAAGYTNVVYSGDGWIKSAKADKAELNKLRTAIETERKRIKKQCMDPYTAFEAQVKEVIAPLDEAIASIDKQIKAADEAARTVKEAEIRKLFEAEGFQDFVELEMIWNEKWLNKTYSLAQIEQDMEARKYEIGRGVLAIHSLPEYEFEAMDYFKKTLDLPRALSEAQRLVDLQKHKEAAAAAESERKRVEEERRQAEELKRQQAAEAEAKKAETAATAQQTQEQEEVFQVDVRVWGTKTQLHALSEFLKANGIKYGKVGN